VSVAHDRAEVARIACANPGESANAVARYYGVTRQRAHALMSAARRAGFDIPSDNLKPTYDRAEVARVARAGLPSMGAAVAAHFKVSRTHANRLIDIARKSGHDIPRVGAPRKVQVTRNDSSFGAFELVCACGYSSPLMAGMGPLVHHTTSAHGRRPTQAERTPRKSQRLVA